MWLMGGGTSILHRRTCYLFDKKTVYQRFWLRSRPTQTVLLCFVKLQWCRIGLYGLCLLRAQQSDSELAWHWLGQQALTRMATMTFQARSSSSVPMAGPAWEWPLHRTSTGQLSSSSLQALLNRAALPVLAASKLPAWQCVPPWRWSRDRDPGPCQDFWVRDSESGPGESKWPGRPIPVTLHVYG